MAGTQVALAGNHFGLLERTIPLPSPLEYEHYLAELPAWDPRDSPSHQ
jgi:hypothetical protein